MILLGFTALLSLMTLTGLLLVIAASVAWAALDAVRKGLAVRVEPIAAVAWMSVGQVPLFAAWIVVQGEAFSPNPAYWGPGAVLALINIAANVMLVKSFAMAPLSLVVPLLSLTPALSAGAAWVIHREWPGLRGIVGIFVIVLAALVIGGVHQRLWARWRKHDVDPVEPKVRTGIILMLAVACCFATSGALDKLCLNHVGIAQHAMIQSAAVAVGCVLWLLVRGKGAKLLEAKSAVWLLLGSVVFLAGALVLQLMAYSHALVSGVEAGKRAIGMILAAANGRVFFGEPLRPATLVGVAAMIVGVCLLVL